MILAYQMGIFLSIMIASWFGFIPLLVVDIIIVCFSLSNIFTASLLVIQGTTILVANLIGIMICVIRLICRYDIYTTFMKIFSFCKKKIIIKIVVLIYVLIGINSIYDDRIKEFYENKLDANEGQINKIENEIRNGISEKVKISKEYMEGTTESYYETRTYVYDSSKYDETIHVGGNPWSGYVSKATIILQNNTELNIYRDDQKTVKIEPSTSIVVEEYSIDEKIKPNQPSWEKNEDTIADSNINRVGSESQYKYNVKNYERFYTDVVINDVSYSIMFDIRMESTSIRDNVYKRPENFDIEGIYVDFEEIKLSKDEIIDIWFFGKHNSIIDKIVLNKLQYFNNIMNEYDKDFIEKTIGHS